MPNPLPAVGRQVDGEVVSISGRWGYQENGRSPAYDVWFTDKEDVRDEYGDCQWPEGTNNCSWTWTHGGNIEVTGSDGVTRLFAPQYGVLTKMVQIDPWPLDSAPARLMKHRNQPE